MIPFLVLPAGLQARWIERAQKLVGIDSIDGWFIQGLAEYSQKVRMPKVDGS